jgi:hypothetical protein
MDAHVTVHYLNGKKPNLERVPLTFANIPRVRNSFHIHRPQGDQRSGRPEASHEDLPLAILIALLRARRAAAASAASLTAVPQVRAAPGEAVCSDNFA